MKTRPAFALAALIAASTWLLAHEGHDALPRKGVSVKGDTVALTVDARKALDVKTTPVEKRTLERTVLAPAAVVLRPEAHAFASALLPGRIERVLVTPGQQVQAGDMLALVRSPELERLQTEGVTARLELELAETKLKQAEALARDKLGAPLDLLAARNRRQEKANALRLAQLKLQALGVDLTSQPPSPDRRGGQGGEVAAGHGLLPIRAPLAGVVAHLDIAPGIVIEPDQHLFEIAAPARVWLRADVPEAYVRQIAVGNDVYVRLQNAHGLARVARPESSTEVAHLQTSTTPVENSGRAALRGVLRARQGRVEVKTLAEPAWIDVTDAALTPGMAGHARIVVERRPDVLCVPENAVTRDGMESFVFVQTEPGKYERTRVGTGLAAGGWVQITGGLFVIDEVVTQGQRQLASLFVQGVLRPSPQARKNAGLRVEPVGRRPIATTIELDAVLEAPPQNRAVVASPLAGKVTQLFVAEPRDVSPGEPLAGLASLEFQNLQLELIQAELAVRLQSETLEAYRRADPEERGIIARPMVEEARSGLQVAEARRVGLTRRLQDVGLTEQEVDAIREQQRISGELILRAPRRGGAILKDIAPGQVVVAGKPLFEVQDRSRLWARGRVPQEQLGLVRVGQPARLRLAAAPAFLAEAKLSRLGSLPEADGLVRSVWAEFQHAPGDVKENMLGRLTVVLDPGEETLALPLSAVTRDGSRTAVFVHEEKADRFTLRPVQLGRQDDLFVEVQSGLKPGELVAVSAVADLRRGYGRIK